ncbi:hypothetical protein GOQ29_05755 [Clostridium sp. D2Q-14]|uniref:hypothetical protein n=1 Tax=Anaeromonas gelatinilytica TaxID=2683194 RepID=UPI00193B3BF7|nr:hypothetical protein [Anaeromonas gelatinilytica]MBS4535123.1 hypothetical protein [Anaeromonas gelatinilytica]
MKKIASQWLKTKHTLLRPLLIILPVLFALGTSFYLAGSASWLSKEEIFQSFFLLLNGCALFFAAVFIYLIVDIDKRSQHFFQEKRPDAKKSSIFLAKIVFICLVIFTLYFLAIVSFTLLQNLLLHQWMSITSLIKISLTSYLLVLPMVALYTWLSYHFSLNITIITAVFSTLTGLLMGTTDLGGNLWKLIPPTWGLKIIHSYILVFLGENIGRKQTVLFFIVISLLLFLGSYFLQIFWYNKWEEKKLF